MSLYKALFGSATALALAATVTPAAAQEFHPSDETRDAGQTDFVQDNSGPNCVRDDFGFCAQNYRRDEPTSRPRADFGCSQDILGRYVQNRWGGRAMGQFRAQETAVCRAQEQIYNLSEQHGGWENVPPHMQRSAERALYMATRLGPQRQWGREIQRHIDNFVSPR